MIAENKKYRQRKCKVEEKNKSRQGAEKKEAQALTSPATALAHVQVPLHMTQHVLTNMFIEQPRQGYSSSWMCS